MAKANMKYTKIEDDDARKWLEVLLNPHRWDKYTFDEMLLVQYYAQKYEDYWFTRKSTHWSSRKEGELLIAAEPNVKLVGNLRGVYSTYKRSQFALKPYIIGGSNGWHGMEGLLAYLEERKDRGEDVVFQEQVDECVRRLKLNYEKNRLSRLRRFTEENVTEEYIRDRVRKHLVSISQGDRNGMHWNWADYTMFLQRKETGRYQATVPILKPTPVMFDADIITYMQEALSYNSLKRDGFSGTAIAAAIPKVVEHYWEDTVAAIRLAETAARSWCAVWLELLGDEEE